MQDVSEALDWRERKRERERVEEEEIILSKISIKPLKD